MNNFWTPQSFSTSKKFKNRQKMQDAIASRLNTHSASDVSTSISSFPHIECNHAECKIASDIRERIVLEKLAYATSVLENMINSAMVLLRQNNIQFVRDSYSLIVNNMFNVTFSSTMNDFLLAGRSFPWLFNKSVENSYSIREKTDCTFTQYMKIGMNLSAYSSLFAVYINYCCPKLYKSLTTFKCATLDRVNNNIQQFIDAFLDEAANVDDRVMLGKLLDDSVDIFGCRFPSLSAIEQNPFAYTDFSSSVMLWGSGDAIAKMVDQYAKRLIC